MTRCSSFIAGAQNLRILQIEPVKAVPYVPLSHPFVERLIRTIRREFLDIDQTPFWNARDPRAKTRLVQGLLQRRPYARALGGQTPIGLPGPRQPLERFRWQNYGRGLFVLPAPA
jgi:hypothetical protein